MELIRKPLALALALLLSPVCVNVTTLLNYTDHEPLGGTRTRFINFRQTFNRLPERLQIPLTGWITGFPARSVSTSTFTP